MDVVTQCVSGSTRCNRQECNNYNNKAADAGPRFTRCFNCRSWRCIWPLIFLTVQAGYIAASTGTEFNYPSSMRGRNCLSSVVKIHNQLFCSTMGNYCKVHLDLAITLVIQSWPRSMGTTTIQLEVTSYVATINSHNMILLTS